MYLQYKCRRLLMIANDYLDGFIVKPEATHEGLLAKPAAVQSPLCVVDKKCKNYCCLNMKRHNSTG